MATTYQTREEAAAAIGQCILELIDSGQLSRRMDTEEGRAYVAERLTRHGWKCIPPAPPAQSGRAASKKPTRRKRRG
jgi:hypothetical protein